MIKININEVVLIIYIGLIAFVVLYGVKDINEQYFQRILGESQRASMYDVELLDLTDDLITNGYFSHEGYYCVWTKGRTEEEITRTDTHEICHALVFENNEHFCGQND